MKKFTYWVAVCNYDHSAYSIRCRTKKECAMILKNHWDPSGYDLPKKHTVEFEDTFDLIKQCLGESRIGE